MHSQSTITITGRCLTVEEKDPGESTCKTKRATQEGEENGEKAEKEGEKKASQNQATDISSGL